MMKKLLSLFVVLLLVKSAIAQPAADTGITFTWSKPMSAEAKGLKAELQKMDFKTSQIKDFETKNFNQAAAPLPPKYTEEFNVDSAVVTGRNVYTVSPKNKTSGKYILYLHGGGYMYGIGSYHWDLIGELLRRTNATVIFPDYPLTPAHTAEEGFVQIDQVYKNLLSKVPPDSVVIMGDSAGGGFALALAEQMKKEGVPQPSQLILLSPWLDATMTNPGIKSLEKKDVMVAVTFLKMIGKAWAGKLSTTNYLVSPIYGNLNGLAKVSVFTGGQEILLADCRKFKSMMNRKGIPVNYFYYQEMFHDWALASFLPESRMVLDQVSSLIGNNTKTR
ncbi:alpha/beta hydrolase [Mucilaginibacter sp.]|uniref:alpha/beta hydrolase n=1 Tax=Mucilaginibacter sp. TaxID=1882438 RepID=UPI0026061613|nr:alpha/beta hydrolase [Mucilaginibacter sp.]